MITYVGWSVPFKLSLAPTIVSGRRIGFSDQSAYPLWGMCNDHGSTISVSGDVSATTTCDGYAWEIELNFSAMADGPVNISISQSGTQSPDPISLSLVKDTTFCSTNPTHASGFAGGDGSLGNPYKICTLEQLANLEGYNNLSHYFELKDSIDFSLLESTFNSNTSVKDLNGNRFAWRNIWLPDHSNSLFSDWFGAWGSGAYSIQNTLRGLVIEKSGMAVGDSSDGCVAMLVETAFNTDLIDISVSAIMNTENDYAATVACSSIGFLAQDIITDVNSQASDWASYKVSWGVIGYNGSVTTERVRAYGITDGIGISLISNSENNATYSFVLKEVKSSVCVVRDDDQRNSFLLETLQSSTLEDSYTDGVGVGRERVPSPMLRIGSTGRPAAVSRVYSSVISTSTDAWSEWTGGIARDMNDASSLNDSFAAGVNRVHDSNATGGLVESANGSSVILNGHYWEHADATDKCINRDNSASVDEI